MILTGNWPFHHLMFFCKVLFVNFFVFFDISFPFSCAQLVIKLWLITLVCIQILLSEDRYFVLKSLSPLCGQSNFIFAIADLNATNLFVWLAMIRSIQCQRKSERSSQSHWKSQRRIGYCWCNQKEVLSYMQWNIAATFQPPVNNLSQAMHDIKPKMGKLDS